MNDRNKPFIILMAEDDADDRLLVKDALRECQCEATLQFVENGEELLDYLFRRAKYRELDDSPRPGLIILDLNMPRKDGREALREIKSDPTLRQIPVVVLTTSKAEEDILRTYELGVNSFITKPVTFAGLVEALQAFSRYWFEIVELPNGASGASDGSPARG